jgi:hypothetical protein
MPMSRSSRSRIRCRGRKTGLVGRPPSLLDLDDGDLKMTVDFRRIDAAVLQDWLALPLACRPWWQVRTAPAPRCDVTRARNRESVRTLGAAGVRGQALRRSGARRVPLRGYPENPREIARSLYKIDSCDDRVPRKRNHFDLNYLRRIPGAFRIASESPGSTSQNMHASTGTFLRLGVPQVQDHSSGPGASGNSLAPLGAA